DRSAFPPGFLRLGTCYLAPDFHGTAASAAVPWCFNLFIQRRGNEAEQPWMCHCLLRLGASTCKFMPEFHLRSAPLPNSRLIERFRHQRFHTCHQAEPGRLEAWQVTYGTQKMPKTTESTC